MLSLLDGVDRGTATVVTLGTTTAARSLWGQIRRRAKRAGPSLGEEHPVLAAEPGEAVDADALLRLLREIPRYDLRTWASHSDSVGVGRDYINVAGDYIGRDKVTIYNGPVASPDSAGPVTFPGAHGVDVPTARPGPAQTARSGPAQTGWTEPAQTARTGPAQTGWTGPAQTGQPSGAPGPALCDIGVITVLSEETRAVSAMLAAAGDMRSQVRDGLRFREATIETPGRAGANGQTVTVAATQTLDRGQQAAAMAFHNLQRYYAPTTVVLAGIAGGVNPDVRLGDVVVAQQVIYYDLRKERPDEVVHAGKAREVPAVTRSAVNAFFSDHGEPYRASVRGQDHSERTCNVLHGPIGTGEAVVANKDSETRQYLARFNYKTLALETEAGGLVEAFYQMGGTAPAASGWLVVRGISDHADEAKNDAYHEIASWHAAEILRQLLPYLKPGPGARG